MIVAVAVSGTRVAAWEGALVQALRAAGSPHVRVVQVSRASGRAVRGLAGWLGGTALAPVTLAVDGDAAVLRSADIVVDLSEGGLLVDVPGGIWRLRLADSDDYDLPFGREFTSGMRSLDVVLYRRQGGRIEELRRGRFGVYGSYSATLRLILMEVATWPAMVVNALAEFKPSFRPYVPPARTARICGIRLLWFAFYVPVHRVSSVLRGLVVVDQWNVGFAKGNARTLLSGEPLDVRWLPAPAARTFMADPFLVERAGIRALLVEAYDYERDRGVIDALTLDDDGRVIARERAIDAPTHLSYPFPLEIDGELYLVPESSAGNEVALYRCVEFPTRWVREGAVFAGFDGVDTTIFPYEGRWWAMCTRVSRGSNLSLHAFHAPSPRGPWTAHLLNPIVVDVGRARPAGPPFELDGRLYRPGQDCSQTYGGAIAISRVDRLTPAEYREKIVARLEPKAGTVYGDGLHTVSVAGDTIVLDGKHTYVDVRYVSRLGRLLRARRVQRRQSAAIPAEAGSKR